MKFNSPKLLRLASGGMSSVIFTAASICFVLFSQSSEAIYDHSLSLDMGIKKSPFENSRLWTGLSGAWTLDDVAHIELGGFLGYSSVLSGQRRFSGALSLRYHFYMNAEVSVYPLVVLESEHFEERTHWLGLGAGSSIMVEPFEFEVLSWFSLNTKNDLRLFCLESRVAIPLRAEAQEKDLFGIFGKFNEYESSNTSVATLGIFFSQRF